MTTIAEHIFTYHLDDLRLSESRLLAHAHKCEEIVVGWSSPSTKDARYVVFSFIKEDTTFDPSYSPGPLLGIGRKVEPKTYTLQQFQELIKDARYIRFVYKITLDIVHDEDVEPQTSYGPNYPSIISELEKKKLVVTKPTTTVLCSDPRKFTVVTGESISSPVFYDVDCLGTSLYTEMSREVEKLYLESFTR